MNKKIKWIIGVAVVLVFIFLCVLVNSQSFDKSLIVEDGVIKYKNNGNYEEVISLEDLLTKEENSAVTNGKELEFSIQDGYIVWNYVGETKVNKIIAIKKLVGKQGTNGKDGVNGVDGINGIDGKSAYIWVKYLDSDPTLSSDSDLKDETSSYMGIYYGEASEAPTLISSYKWYLIKGEKGDTGEQGIQGFQGIQGPQGKKGETGAKGDKGDAGTNGTDGKNAYVWIKYLDKAPESATNSDMKDNGGKYIGVYSGESSVAPTSISSYTWSKLKEESSTGSIGSTDIGNIGSIDIETNNTQKLPDIYYGHIDSSNEEISWLTVYQDSASDVICDENGIKFKSTGKYRVELYGTANVSGENYEFLVYLANTGWKYYIKGINDTTTESFFYTKTITVVNNKFLLNIAASDNTIYDVDYTVKIFKIS